MSTLLIRVLARLLNNQAVIIKSLALMRQDKNNWPESQTAIIRTNELIEDLKNE